MKQYLLLCLALSLLVGCKNIPANITVSNKVITENSISMDVLGEDVDGIKQCQYAVYEIWEQPTYTTFESPNCGTLIETELRPATTYLVRVRLESWNPDTQQNKVKELILEENTLNTTIPPVEDTPARIAVRNKSVGTKTITMNVKGIDPDGIQQCEYAVYARGKRPQYTTFDNPSCGQLSATDLTPNTDYTVSITLSSWNKHTLRYEITEKTLSQTTLFTSDINFELIKDDGLREHIRTVSEGKTLSDITSIYYRYPSTPQDNADSISSLEGIEQFTYATSITIGGYWPNKTRLSDLSPLSGMRQLTWLNLENNNITDLAPLAGLTNLTHLTLEHNSISDITPLAKLTMLTTLDLSLNQITNLEPLSDLTQLTSLVLSKNEIANVSPLFNLTQLNHLDLVGNLKVLCSDIEKLIEKLPKLSYIGFWDRSCP